MHGYELAGMPPMAHGPPPSMSNAQMETGAHHPDSTDSYVTYLESDDSMQGSP
jgi:insulin gene enhancer protein ISL-1